MSYRARKILLILGLVFVSLWLFGVICLFIIPSSAMYAVLGSGLAYILLSVALFFVSARWIMLLAGVILLIIFGVATYVERTTPAPAQGATVGVYQAPPRAGAKRRVRFTGASDGYAIDVTRTVTGVLDIGRDPACGLTIANGSVSRRHVRITAQNGLLYAVNLSSTNPALLNGLRFDTMAPLKSGDRLTMGNVTVLLSIA